MRDRRPGRSGRRLAGTSGEFAAGHNAWRWTAARRWLARARRLYFVRLVTPFGTRTGAADPARLKRADQGCRSWTLSRDEVLPGEL